MKRTLFAAVVALALSSPGLVASDVAKDTLGMAKSVARSTASLLSGEVSGVRVSSLDGSLSGVQSVLVRGLNTLRGDSQPIWIVDGVVLSPSAFENRDLFFRSDYTGSAYTAPKDNMNWLNSYEVESIQVIKDMSEAGKYGVWGANGVIIVTTRKARGGRALNVHLNSNAGVDFRPKAGDAFRSSFFHNHDLGIDGSSGNNSTYKISGFFRSNDGTVKGETDRSLGLAVGFETMANKTFKFGLNSFLGYDKSSSSYGTNCIGATSAMIVSRYPTSFSVDTVQGWLDDYDDDSESMRSASSVYLKIDFLPGFFLKLTGGVDYQNQNRIVWFGDSTAFGHKVGGAAGVLNNSLLNYNTGAQLEFTRNFASHHHLEAGLAFDFTGSFNRTNAMCASNFDLPYLRGKGLSASTGGKRIRKFSRTFNHLGYMAHVDYDYKGMFGAGGSFRMDHNMKYRTPALMSPTANAFVDFRKIFLPQSKVLSELKISGGWGTASREYDLPYEYLNYYILNVPAIESKADYYYNGLNTLRSSEYNVGLKAGFLSGRFSLGVKYYSKSTDDAFRVMSDLKIVDKLYDKADGWKMTQERHTCIGNSGFEFDIELGLVRSKNVNWTLGANLSRNINRIVSIDDLDGTDAGIVKGFYLAGQQAGCAVSGNCIPKISGAMDTRVEFYGATLDLKLSGASDFEILNANYILKYPQNILSEEMFEKGDYLRLDRLGVSYLIPLKSRAVKELRVNAAGHNLFTFTKYSGWNPDVNSYGIYARCAGADYGSYPLPRSFVFGVNLKF
ncbi:MAG: TonB-dependent receptor plug domain-containing protein [Bacteroidales bacterium]|nr:TonB-dependent receptor plug domain-containing protein [Bacteroidales bacterium]